MDMFCIKMLHLNIKVSLDYKWNNCCCFTNSGALVEIYLQQRKAPKDHKPGVMS